eukprot:NODE_2468_length_690_cov_228.698908_g2016_i0.p3 GENE.NODE_2468_length_690_cov_228.698908_g2016_i0~~NODE_2468_length_690_cov_228.698908_g2016_i0.p3  ORF type:complete len:67 (+),score=4.34 NODE_2468_length_690_cov_228.698908_g2016_i0:44-244(+)
MYSVFYKTMKCCKTNGLWQNTPHHLPHRYRFHLYCIVTLVTDFDFDRTVATAIFWLACKHGTIVCV